MAMGRSDLIHPWPTRPRGVIDCDHALGIGAGRVRPSDLSEMHGKGRLEPRLFPGPGLHLAVSGLVEQPRRQLPCHQIERCQTVDEVLVIPASHQRAMALDPQGGMERRDQRKTRFVLA